MTSFAMTFAGPPIPKARVRGGNGTYYTPRHTRDQEDALAMSARDRKWFVKLDGDVAVQLDFYCGGYAGDIDNLAKLVLDGLQKGGVFKNDRQVVELHCRVHHVDDPKQERTDILAVSS